MANTRKILGNLTHSVKTTLEAGIPATVSYLAHTEILEPSHSMANNDVREGAVLISSLTNQFVAAVALVQFLATLLSTGAWQHLSAKDWWCVALFLVCGATAFGFAATRFGVEDNAIAAGFSASSGVVMFGGAERFMQYRIYMHKENQNPALERERLLGTQEVDETGIPRISLGT